MKKITLVIAKSLIVLFLYLFSFSAVCQLSPKPTIINDKYPEIVKIYINLIRHTGCVNLMVPLYIINDDGIINAEATTTGIYLYTGMIKLVNNDPDKLAMILGHEMGHVYLGHIFITAKLSTINSQKIESEADKIGAFFMMRAGYNECNGREWIRDINNIYGDFGFADHPDNAYRYSQLDIGCTKEDF